MWGFGHTVLHHYTIPQHSNSTVELIIILGSVHGCRLSVPVDSTLYEHFALMTMHAMVDVKFSSIVPGTVVWLKQKTGQMCFVVRNRDKPYLSHQDHRIYINKPTCYK